LGIGGYHTITSVSTTLTPSSFTTSIKAQHYYSGDGEVGSIQPKTSVPKGLDAQLIEMGIPEADQTLSDKVDCKREIVHLQDVGRGAVVGQLQSRTHIPLEEIEAQTSEPAPTTPATSTPVTTTGAGTYMIDGVDYEGEFIFDGSTEYFIYTDSKGLYQEVEVK
jgi:hypothetical protein